MVKLFCVSIAALFISPLGFAEIHRSELREVSGIKFPNSKDEGERPVSVSVLTLAPGAIPRGFTELLPFALRSPDQEEAGSCLYMSLTGIAEWWLARLHPAVSRAPDGPLDLSERYLMNLAGMEEDQNGIADWKTDSIFLFNKEGGTLRNEDYRFTKGWYTRDAEGALHAATRGTPRAVYDASYNWIDEREKVGKIPLVKLPHFHREVLFADPDSNQWNTGVMPSDIVERIKSALKEKKAPVHIIYNHFGYWHATVILGFDDAQGNRNCKFVRDFMAHMAKSAADARKEAAETTDPEEKEKLLKSAEKSEHALSGTRRAWDNGGGCHPKGIFYVRDSIYGDENGPVYDYDLSQKGEESPYVKATVLLEYDWVRYMANHATQITVE